MSFHLNIIARQTLQAAGGVAYLFHLHGRLAALVASLEGSAATSGVVLGIAPWHEALAGDDALAAQRLPAFVRRLLPLLRSVLPAPRYEVHLNWANRGVDWARWARAHAHELGPQVGPERLPLGHEPCYPATLLPCYPATAGRTRPAVAG